MHFFKETVSVLVLVVTASAFPLAPASPQSSNLPTSSPVSSPATEPADIDGVAAVLKDEIDDEDGGSGGLGPTAKLDNPNYFEGDLIISQEMIDTYYGTPNKAENITHLTTKRAVQRNRNRRWQNAIVYYSYDSSICSAQSRSIIDGAIREIERETCIDFRMRSYGDHIRFTSVGSGCASHVGREGGRQDITLPFGCITHGIVLHEICHALGVWHEQSRPDRNTFVRILTQNIRNGQGHNFELRTLNEVNSYGESYDYGSIMHYTLGAFSRNGRNTIEVVNSAEYRRQGSPAIGQRVGLSESDIRQLNRMYDCTSRVLRVYVKYGRNLPDSDGFWAGDSDPYVKIRAVDVNGGSVTHETRYIQGNENPNWYQWLDFGRRSWQHIEISSWDDDVFSDDRLTSTETFSVSPGNHRNLRHCGGSSCHAYVMFDYELN